MNENRWQLNRAGLINFWYYDDEEFQFDGGKLLLRGSNGSGKSVTMQSLIPLLLDGNKSPERLDPFGSKARKIENYLLGDDETEKEEAIGYLYIEFKKQVSEQYTTIGMGLKAKKGNPVKSWGFSLTDGRRVGKDFFLYKDGLDRLPLTMKELENRVSNGGHVYEHQGDYKKHVNDLLFGFSDLDEYDELIKLLVQLRTPKLSKDFRPTVIYEIMENSLQPLSEDDLRPMSEAIENMDIIKSKYDELLESKSAIDKIKSSFDKYNEFMLYDKAKLLIDSKKILGEKEKQKNSTLVEINTNNKAILELKNEFDRLKILLSTSEQKRSELENNDSVKIYEKLVKLEKEMDDLLKYIENKQEQLDVKQNKELDYIKKLKNLSDGQKVLNDKISSLLAELDDFAKEFEFEEQSFLKSELQVNLSKEYSFNYVKKQLNLYTSLLETALELIKIQEDRNRSYNETLKSFDESKNKKNEMFKNLENSRNLLLETKDEYIEKIINWHKNNQELLLTQDMLINLSREVNNFSENSSFENLSTYVRNTYNLHQKEINMEYNASMSKLEQVKTEIENKQIEINEWKSLKEPEPNRDERVLLNRQKLKEANIPFIPFYLTIDFNNIDDKLKGKIEEALVDMGILDALIIPKRFQTDVLKLDTSGADKYLFAKPSILNHTLEEYLHADNIAVEGISKQDVIEVLSSILLSEDDDEIYIDDNGSYSLGLIKGKISGNYNTKFIGSSSRKRYKEEMVNILESDMSLIKNNYNSIMLQVIAINRRLEILENEYNSKPSYADIETAISQIKEAEFNYKKSDEEVKLLIEKEKVAYTELKAAKEEVIKVTNKVQLGVNLDTYKNAINYAKDYKNCLYEMEIEHNNYLKNNENYNFHKEGYESNLKDIDHLNYELNINERKLKEANINKVNLEEQLKLTDYESIKKELEECVKLLNEIPELRISTANTITALEIKVNYAKDNLMNLDIDLANNLQEFSYFQKLFLQEYQLGYVIKFEEKDEINLAKQVLKEIDNNSIKDKDKLINSIYEKYQQYNLFLRDYFIQINPLFSNELKPNPNLPSGERLNIVGKVRGKEVNLYNIIDFIDGSIDECQKLLKERDRELFEDILVNNISKKIRAKIYHSQQWVDKMNKLMESMNTSSGLSFSLKWSSKKAESEDQIDSSELIELLKLDGHLMKQDDIEKLSAHFRSKLSEARRISQDNSDHKSFHVIIKEILDYRRWFEFKLFYLKKGQSKKELTNNAFYQFSGGEKAMSMYVPLFSAVYAKYEGARNNCPKIISLDEAFAGVDEKNIRDMFRLLSQLEFNFIINSQILWGDYDTIDSLAICELIRYDNADFVTVLRYKWNGITKELVV
ncbi:MAG: putative chromosome segregation ATPase [Haloplasmataceae bacterium]|nr:putative chromosome segregation ATPase [Haloplasmataceae bacterium]